MITTGVNLNDRDSNLIKAYYNGDDSAISELFAQYESKIYNYILLVTKNDIVADDIYQDLFIKVSQSLKKGKYVDNGKFMSWVLRIAHNQIIDHYRVLKQRKGISIEEQGSSIEGDQVSPEISIEDKMIAEQVQIDVRRLVDSLPMEQREVVIMRHYLDMSFKDIAEQTGVSINTALGRMRYALINLRKMMGGSALALDLNQ